MRFANMHYAGFVIITAVLIIIAFVVPLFKRRNKINFSNFSGIKKYGINSFMASLPQILKAAGIIILLTALLRPQLVKKDVRENIRATDIMIALDVSGSMQADDLKPNRLEAAKRVVSEFLSGLKGDRAGLVVFAGKSFTQCPLTTDYEIVKELAAQLDFNSVRIDGTAVGEAILNAVNRLEKSTTTKVIILTTDGVSNRGISPVEAAKIAAYKGIKLYTIGIGKKGGAPIMGRDIYGNYGQLLDRFGRPAKYEEPDEETLRQAAEITGGKYFRATDNSTLDSIYKTIASLEKKEIEVKVRNKYKELFVYFLWAGLIMVVLAGILEIAGFVRVLS